MLMLDVSSSRRSQAAFVVSSIVLLFMSSCIHQSSAASYGTESGKNTSAGGSGKSEKTQVTKAPTSEQSKPAKDVGVNGSSTGDDENNNETGASGDEGGKEKSDEDNEDKRERGEKEEGGNGFKQTIKKLSDMLSNNKSAVQNMMFALIGLTSLVVLYFIIKTMRLRQKKSKNRKYGVLTNGMEMDHLESDSDDEDTTVFEINHRR